MPTKSKRERESSPGSIENDRRRMLKGLRVLVVEDVGMVAMALKSMVEEIGCEVVGMAARLREA
jgi:adenine/guanine phosphoribosyltransferase-like PRPP-binding protein